MPRRTREHELETQSRVAFERALGNRFVFRSEEPDYGLDGSVEEFDPRSRATTGLRFFVQLKATDSEDLQTSLRARIPLETADYYRALPLPLLMVRYVASSDRIFTRWFHQFDPYYGGLGEKGLTFRWEEDDEWRDDRPGELVADVRAFLRWRSPSLPLPLSIRRERPTEGAFDLSASEFRVALQRSAEARPDVLRFRGGTPEAGEARVEVSDDHIGAALGNVTGAVLHIDERYRPGELGVQAAVDAFAMLALAFENIGQDELASRVGSAFFADSTLARTVEPALAISAAMARTHRVREALSLAERLDTSGDPAIAEASFAFTLPALAQSASLTREELEEYRTTMRSRIQRRHDSSDVVGVARESYGLGNHYRAHGESEDEALEAVRLYEDAARYQPAYLERTHYWFELGGALFFAERYADAATAYDRAVKLGSDRVGLALQADSLMFHGDYERARQLFESFNAGDVEDDRPRLAEFRLKEFLLHVVIDQLGISRQERQPDAALQLSGAVDGNLHPEEAVATLNEALNLDALCGLAWFNRGAADQLRGSTQSVFVDYLVAALLQPWDAEAWGNAVTLAALSEGAETFLGDILVTARRVAGEAAVMEHVIRAARAQREEFPHEEFAGSIQGIFDNLPPEPVEGFTLRSLGEGGAVEETFLSIHTGEA